VRERQADIAKTDDTDDCAAVADSTLDL